MTFPRLDSLQAEEGYLLDAGGKMAFHSWLCSPAPPGRFFQSLTFSPDGRQLVFTATPGGQELVIESGPQLFVRGLASLDTRPLAETEGVSGLGTGATGAFFSSDGRWLGFFSDRKLKKIPLEGGSPSVICETCTVYGHGAVWLGDDTIVLGDRDPKGVGLQRVPAAGGVATQLTTLGDGEVYHQWPTLLPGGRELLFVVVDERGQRLEVVDLETGHRRKVEGVSQVTRPRPGSLPRPTRLFEDRYWMGTVTHMERNNDVAPDGRFLMLELVEDEDPEPARIVVVQNWFQELERLVPIG